MNNKRISRALSLALLHLTLQLHVPARDDDGVVDVRTHLNG